MVPIRKGDGTGLTVPGFEQVRTGDGRVLYEDSAIPDIAVLRWQMDEGSGSTVSDSIGDNDGSFDGDPEWESDSDFIGGEKVALDGDGDWIDADDDTVLSTGDSFSVGITIDAESSISDDSVAWTWSDGTDLLTIAYRNGDWTVGRWDGSDYVSSHSHPEPSAPYTIRLLMTYDGEGDESMELYLNTDPSTGTTDPRSDTSQGLRVGADTDGGRELTAAVDDVTHYDEVLDSAAIQDDYERQPWSESG